MGKVGAYEAKTHLPQILERVSKGEHITITKHGTPVAKLIPTEPKEKKDIQAVIAAIRAYRDRHPLKDLSIPEMIREGRRH